MAYKGDDLDLRSAQGGPRMFTTGMGSGPDGFVSGHTIRAHREHHFKPPGWLNADGTLLSCCNHAYEIASANGSREILLEHLIHAFTRVPDAAQHLESEGFHVMALRRDSAGVIADDLPISPSHSGAPVQPSDAFFTVLHRASTAAAQAGRASTVGDVLAVLVRFEGETAAVDLLRRHHGGWASGQRFGESRALPMPRPREMPAPPPRYLNYDRFEQATWPREVPQRSDAIGMWNGLEQRLNVLEQGIGTLASEKSIDRRALSDLVHSFEQTMSKSKLDAQALRSTLDARMESISRALENGRGGEGGSNVEAVLGPRLNRIEKMQETLLDQRSNLTGLEGQLTERLQRFEKLIEQNKLDPAKLPAGLSERIQGLERVIENKLAELSRTWTALGERLGRIEKAMEDDTKAEAMLVSRLDRLQAQLEGMSRAMPAGFVERMEAMEKSFEARIAEGIKSFGGIGERLSGFERALSAQRAELAHAQSALSAQIKESNVTQLQQLREQTAAHMQQLLSQSPKLPGNMAERLENIERFVTKIPVPDMSDIRNQLARLASADQTLAQAIDQWRLDNTGDLGIISNRLEALEHSGVRPTELLETINTRMQSMSGTAHGTSRPTSAVQHRRGFWRWLFGLD
jgi:tetratricopeptide (TPR) repeat protein